MQPPNGHTLRIKPKRSKSLILAKKWPLRVLEVAGSENALRMLG